MEAIRQAVIEKLRKTAGFGQTWKGLRQRVPKSKVFVEGTQVGTTFKVHSDELPILQYLRDESYFHLLTTKRIHVFRNGKIKSVLYSDILNYDRSYVDRINLNEVPYDVEFKLNLIKGGEIILSIETGNPMHTSIIIINHLKGR